MKITKFFALLCAATVGFVACEPIESNEPTPEPQGSITLKADKTTLQLGESVTFTVTDSEGQDVTAAASIYDSELNNVANPYTPAASGLYTFNATIGAEASNFVTITVMAQMPDVPEDLEPENLAFHHRGLFIDNTGKGCGYCPSVIDIFKSLEATETHNYYHEVQVHGGGYAEQYADPAFSAAAKEVDKFYKPDGYPDVRLNFYGGNLNRSVAGFKNALMSYIKKDGADAGIAMAVDGDSTYIYCAAQVKAAVEQEYKVVAWLLESNIYSPGQSGATKDYHKIYNYALRNISGTYSKNNIQGESIGVLAEGETHDCAFMLPIISNNWKWENMGVLVIVSAKDAQGRWEVANAAYCNLGESKTYVYVE